MTRKLRVLLCATIISLGGFLVYLAPTTAAAGPTLQIVEGSKEFEKLVTTTTVSQPEALYMQWTTDQAGATGGTWQVTNVTAGNKVVATGEAGPAPSVGHFARFTIAANAFLQPSPPASPVKFNITIVAHNAAKQTLGGTSPAVVVTQAPEGPPQKPVVFGPGAVFPTVEVVNYVEKIGVVPLTQLHFAGADVTLRVKNTGTAPTDPMWLTVKDNNLLMRQKSPVSIPVLKAGAVETIPVHLDAILPPPKSQLPEDVQYNEWNQEYRDRCGVDLRTVMDWRGPQAQTPIGSHLDTDLAPATICDGSQCVKPCQIAKNIHQQLDGNVVGYTYFVGLYPKYEAAGQARTAADGFRDFTPATKITVASVSKIVTAIAAARILDKNHVKLTDSIGKYFPSDWAVTSYVKNLTFAALLGQRSSIKDYGNVANDYATLKTFFTQTISPSSNTVCDPKDAQGNLKSAPLGRGFVLNNMNWCYSNFNFSIMRILLPKVAGFPEDPNQSTRPQSLADQYIKLVQQNSFDLVGQKNVSCKPPGGTSYSFAYRYPGSSNGFDWGDNSLICGAAGWYLTAEDIARVLVSITTKDGKIFTTTPDQFDDFRQRGLGLDSVSDTELEKNGGWSANCDANGKNCELVSTSVAIFGPVKGPRVVGVLFLNSDISGGPGSGGSAKGVLEKAYKDALFSK
jgi:CubicO group peptidase (beta-lactamase class C family)